MTSHPTAAEAATFTCTGCEVTWTSYDPTCWMCGRDAATNTLLDPTRPQRTTTPVPGPRRTRHADILRAHAMGLPDPRYAVRAGA